MISDHLRCFPPARLSAALHAKNRSRYRAVMRARPRGAVRRKYYEGLEGGILRGTSAKLFPDHNHDTMSHPASAAMARTEMIMLDSVPVPGHRWRYLRASGSGSGWWRLETTGCRPPRHRRRRTLRGTAPQPQRVEKGMSPKGVAARIIEGRLLDTT